MKIREIYYFGNEYIKEDSLAVSVCKKLEKDFKNIKFVHIKNVFELLEKNLDNVLLVDVSKSVKKIELVDSKGVLPGGKLTPHDFDLGSFLSITNKKTKILLIPFNYSKEKACFEITKFLSTSLQLI
ncbi:MAG: hypothetical protein QW273_02555 [Candidatus Pacearchaeota archaeon]